MPEWDILNGDSLEILSKIEDNIFDSVVCDPPYGLSKNPDISEVLKHWLAGDDYKHSGSGFMGKSWDSFVPGPSLWKEVFRVLKPGGHLVAFAGTRTQDLMGISLRLAGFEIRDCIYWHYGQGFPKSMDVSKAIDKTSGAKREIIAPPPYSRGRAKQSYSDTRRVSYDYQPQPITAPSTPEAQAWKGWGTALKPASEPILLCRKPLSEKTVAANVLSHSTGALNIDACRINTNDSLNGGAYAQNGELRDDGWGMQRGGAGQYKQPEGRWPANLVLTHSPGCQQIGQEKIRGYTINRFDDGAKPFGGGAGHEFSSEQKPDELIEKWDCSPDCPIRLLDEQSGELGKSAGTQKKGRGAYGDDKVYGKGKGLSIDKPIGFGDKGGASRFFYCAKTSTKERNAGLDEFTDGKIDDGRNIPADNAFQRGKSIRKNIHPTVKPISLMRWLVRLVTPPEGLVLDPFAGSGTTGIASVLEGFDFIGVDMETDHCETAKARISHWEKEITNK